MDYILSILTFGAIWAILVLSLNILVGYGGQVSLGHAAFFGIGSYTAAIAATRFDLPFLVALTAAVIVTTLAGFVLGLPSLRVRHDFLVLATIGLNFVIVGTLGYVEFFGGALGIVGVPLPAIGEFELRGAAFLAVCVAALALVAFGCRALTRTWAGLALFTLREDEVAAAAVGVGHARYKLAAFALSGTIAGLAGGLYAPFIGNVFPNQFGFTESIALMAMLVLGGVGTIRGAILGALVLKSLPEYLRFGGTYRFALYGAILLLVILLQPEGLLGERSILWRVLHRWLPSRLTKVASPPPASPPRPSTGQPVGGDAAPLLRVEGVTVDFDGLRALDSVSLEVHLGEILGLLGPNGAGKTTLFNAIAGVVRASSGHILLRGKEIQRLPADAVARRGVGRTFQVVRPFRTLPVEDNVLSGAGVQRYSRLGAFTTTVAGERGAAGELVARVGLRGAERRVAGELPIGNLRRLEVGRALALRPSLVLLDEPAAGLTHEEVAELTEVVQTIADEGHAVILVEHNMRFAMAVCDRIVVLAAGRVLAEGLPEEVSADEQVIEAYLGQPAGQGAG